MDAPLQFAYDDLLLTPQHNTFSRKDVDLTAKSKLGTFRVPICSAPMDTVSGPDLVKSVRRFGGLGILHRYMSHTDRLHMIRSIQTDTVFLSDTATPFGVAVGLSITNDEVLELVDAYPDLILCVDVAHGHQDRVRDTLIRIRDVSPQTPLIAGNVATWQGYRFLAPYCDAVKVGIGSGSICSTRLETGHGVPQASAVSECARVSTEGPIIIADGGIRYAGDIVKALALGASMVMLGSMLAGTNETPGEILMGTDGRLRKVYRGMASKEAQEDFGLTPSSLEGVATSVPSKGPVWGVLQDIEARVRSGLCYSGAGSILELTRKANFVRQTGAGRFESSTHIHSVG